MEYKNKYLKYKTKYLKLKNQVGGDNSPTFEELVKNKFNENNLNNGEWGIMNEIAVDLTYPCAREKSYRIIIKENDKIKKLLGVCKKSDNKIRYRGDKILAENYEEFYELYPLDKCINLKPIENIPVIKQKEQLSSQDNYRIKNNEYDACVKKNGQCEEKMTARDNAFNSYIDPYKNNYIQSSNNYSQCTDKKQQCENELNKLNNDYHIYKYRSDSQYKNYIDIADKHNKCDQSPLGECNALLFNKDKLYDELSPELQKYFTNK